MSLKFTFSMLLVFTFTFTFTFAFTCALAQEGEGEGEGEENNFFEYYSQNKDILDKKAPYAGTLENFAEYHDVLLKTIIEFEKSVAYEEDFPIEGKTTQNQNMFRTLQLFKMMLNEANANQESEICYYGGWPSRMVSGKCQAPWKNQNDEGLKSIGPTYESKYYCGRANLFRCNPLLFGPGGDGNGTCIRFSSVAEISSKCFEESRDQVEKIYEKFKTDNQFQRQYLATVDKMVKFCLGRLTYPSCELLVLRTSDVVAKSCGGVFEINQLLTPETVSNLAKDSKRIMDRMSAAPANPIKPEVKPSAKSDKSTENKQAVVSTHICQLYQTFKAKGVPSKPLLQALTYYNEGKTKFKNERYLSIADYSQNSNKKRFYLLDLISGDVFQEKISHGSGMQNGKKIGDSNHDGMLNRCTGYSGSRKNMTRPGFYKVENFYTSSSHNKTWPPLIEGTKLNGMRLVGLSSTNDDVLGKGVVMHEANYNSNGNSSMGRSFGCPAFVPQRGGPLMEKMKGGSLFYAYAPMCEEEMKKVLKDSKVSKWEESCVGE